MGEVRTSVRGRVEYDGMLLVTLRLEPATASRAVSLDGIALSMAMPKSARCSSYLHRPGLTGVSLHRLGFPRRRVVHDNLKAARRQDELPFLHAVHGPRDRPRMVRRQPRRLAGREAKPVQEIVRATNGEVRLVCRLANKPFVLDGPSRSPSVMTPTPAEAAARGLRSFYCNHHALKDIKRTWPYGGCGVPAPTTKPAELLQPAAGRSDELRQGGHQCAGIKPAPSVTST